MLQVNFKNGDTSRDVFKQLQNQGVTRVDAMSTSFSLSAFQMLPLEIRQASWNLLLPETVLNDWEILNSQQDRPFLNQLTVPLWASECLKWIERPSNQIRFSQKPLTMSMYIYHHGEEANYGILGNCALTTDGLGLTPATTLGSTAPMYGPQVEMFSAQFKDYWNANIDTTISNFQRQLHFLADPHPPTWFYYKACHALLQSTENPDDYIKPETGIYDSCVWNKLYSFQRDGVRAVIAKLMKHNGCILADSVGLGKTFEALAVIKYFLLRGANVLVLCPKRLRDNWSIFTELGDKRNVLVKDRLNYTILHHTDLNRKNGRSGTVDLAHFNWGMYDLVVIDESHNFRNRPTHISQSGSRYSLLMKQIIQAGVPTKVLMLSATPVNNRVADLKNQIAFISGDRDDAFAHYGIPSIETTTRNAQQRFVRWLDLPEEERTTSRLLSLLGQDYFQLLDILTIARSRKHIERYYKDGDVSIGGFPQRLEPVNFYPNIADESLFPTIKKVNNDIVRLHMAAYNPLSYVLPEKLDEYMERYTQTTIKGEFRQIDRDWSVSNLIRVNLLKRMESSIAAFRFTVNKQLKTCRDLLDKLERHSESQLQTECYEDEEDEDLEDTIQRGTVEVRLEDVDMRRWISDLEQDIAVLSALAEKAARVGVQQDCKLAELKKLIEAKMETPINEGNHKLIVFTAFADTAEYLYKELAPWAKETFGVYSAVVTGARKNTSNLDGVRSSQDGILSHFSPRSKECPLEISQGREIDILIATDCISEGQNLQDCDYLVNYDIHWNPVRIIQRFGRIDRLGSANKCIQLINFWPTHNLNEYINLESRVRGRMVLLDIAATGDENIIAARGEKQALAYRLKQLERLQKEVVDLEDVDGGLSITDLSMEPYRADLTAFDKLHPGLIEQLPSYFMATLDVSNTDIQAGAFFCLRSHSNAPASADYPLAPYYLVHVAEDGTVNGDYKHVKVCLDLLKKTVWGHEEVALPHVRQFHAKTKNGADMSRYTRLLASAVNAVTGRENESRAASIFTPGGTALGKGAAAKGIDDFEVLAMLALTRS